MNSTTIEILTEARAILSDPKHWTKGTLARAANEREDVREDYSNAVCFCALGAIDYAVTKVMGTTAYESSAVFSAACDAFERGLPEFTSIPAFNDDPKTTHADVLAGFDKALA